MKFAILVVIITLLAVPAFAIDYEITDLGGFSGSRINNMGHVIGSTTASDHAFLWEDGQVTDLGTLGSYWSTARNLNDNDQVVGTSADVNGNNHAFLWQNGSMSAIANNGSEGYDINNFGQVVGHYYDRPGAFLWENGTETIISSFINLSYVANTTVINNNGQVLCEEARMGEYIWQTGQFVRSGITHNADMNDYGQLVGYEGWKTSTADYRACMMDNGVRVFIGDPRSVSTWASRISNNGLVLGGYFEGANIHSFLWQSGQFTDPAELLPQNSGWSQIGITDINDVGQLLGYGISGGQYKSFVLTPVPEPSSVLALGAGIATLTTLKRRRKG